MKVAFGAMDRSDKIEGIKSMTGDWCLQCKTRIRREAHHSSDVLTAARKVLQEELGSVGFKEALAYQYAQAVERGEHDDGDHESSDEDVTAGRTGVKENMTYFAEEEVT